MCICVFPRVDFFKAMLIKTALKQDQKEKDRSKKAKKIIFQGNLNSSFVFQF